MSSDWRLTLPARTPYDRQLLVQCIRRTVTRWGTVRVAIGRCLLVVGGGAATNEPCPLCGCRPGPLRCRLAGRETCVGCALDTAAAERGAEATIGVGAMAPTAPRADPTPHSGSHSNRGDAARPSIAKRRQ
jgi:hypothetical protein